MINQNFRVTNILELAKKKKQNRKEKHLSASIAI
jgi:hypothetical protein